MVKEKGTLWPIRSVCLTETEKNDFLVVWGFFFLFINSCPFCNCHWQNLLICWYVRHLFQGNVCKCSLANNVPTGKPAKFQHSCCQRTRRMFSLLCFWGNAMGQESYCPLYTAHERTQAEHKSLCSLHKHRGLKTVWALHRSCHQLI